MRLIIPSRAFILSFYALQPFSSDVGAVGRRLQGSPARPYLSRCAPHHSADTKRRSSWIAELNKQYKSFDINHSYDTTTRPSHSFIILATAVFSSLLVHTTPQWLLKGLEAFNLCDVSNPHQRYPARPECRPLLLSRYPRSPTSQTSVQRYTASAFKG